MKKIILSIVLAMAMLIPVSAGAEGSVEIFSDKAVMTDGAEITLSSDPFIYTTDKTYLYVPIENIMPALGVGLGWDTGKSAELCSVGESLYYVYPNRNEMEVNGTIVWCNAPAIVKGGTLYVSDEMVKLITGVNISTQTAFKSYVVLDVIGRSTNAFCNGIAGQLIREPYMYNGRLHIPLDDSFRLCGYTLGWDSIANAVVCCRDGVFSYVYINEAKVETDGAVYAVADKPIDINGVMYIDAEAFGKATGCDVNAHGDVKVYRGRDTLKNTVREDGYRLAGRSVSRGGGVVVVDGFGMELVSASSGDAQRYAGVINAVADGLGDVNVYNILVPTAAEFYAPLSMYPNQLTGIRTAYENLSDKVMPVNVYDTLKAHANEKLYFSTDHHWTQRGAYYAYKEFIELKGGTIDDLSTFRNVPSYSFVGSLAGFAKGTAAGNILRSKPELLERFMPKYATVGTVFGDCAVTKKLYTVNAVNTSNNSYSCFIGGDGPVTVFYTDAPSDESIVIIKESFGNAFATWAMHNYKKVCVVDPRKFNGFGGNYASFNLSRFCRAMDIDDVVFINYPVAIASSGIRNAILLMK